MNLCAIDGCEKQARNRGWCDMHYRRWRVHGDTGVMRKAANGDGYLQGGYLGHQIDGVRVFDHVRIAEKALGKKLPLGAVIHHVNEVKTDNSQGNLVICPSKAYHNLLHARMKAMDATGDPAKRRCRHCKEYDSLENLREYATANTLQYWHLQCARDVAKDRYYKEKAK